MISPHFQDRFAGDSGIDIASHAIDAVFPDGEKRRVLLRLGAPFKKPSSKIDVDWWIRSELENLDSTDGPLAGCGSLDTLVAGVRWMVGRLAIFERVHSCRYFWADTDDEFDYRSVFSTAYEKKT